jgi:hypothetical protein
MVLDRSRRRKREGERERERDVAQRGKAPVCVQAATARHWRVSPEAAAGSFVHCIRGKKREEGKRSPGREVVGLPLDISRIMARNGQIIERNSGVSAGAPIAGESPALISSIAHKTKRLICAYTRSVRRVAYIRVAARVRRITRETLRFRRKEERSVQDSQSVLSKRTQSPLY